MKKADHDVPSLTLETLMLHETRLENRYNIYTNLNYMAWLEKFHPDYHKGANFHWAKLSRYPQYMDFHGNTFAVQGQGPKYVYT